MWTLITLLGSLLIKALGLPDDILRTVGLVVLSVVGLSLLTTATSTGLPAT